MPTILGANVRERIARSLGLVLLVSALAGCGGRAACTPFDEDCRRAVDEIEEAGVGEVVSVREVPCVERPGALGCYFLTLAGGEEMPATVYADRVDVGR